LESDNSDFHLWATNVYVPTVDAEHDEFFHKIRHIQPFIDGPWIAAGDFSTFRSGEDSCIV
jgi:hypothetical protein